MKDTQSPFEIEPPSTRRLMTSTLVALGFAGIVLVTMILPAEYGIDPTGIGGALGLTSLSTGATGDEPSMPEVSVPVVASTAGGGSFYVEEMITSDEMIPGGLTKPDTPPNTAIQQTHPGLHKSEVIQIELEPDGKVEYKAQMERGQVLLYSWATERGGVHFDFHAEPWIGPDGYWIRYKVGDGVAADHGSLVTPLDGQHGWYFHNTNDFPVKIELNVSGYYDEVVHYPFY